MKTLKTLLFFCLISIISYAQIRPIGGTGINSNTCGNCNDSNNDITALDGNTFRARYAQAYWWEICNGNATIVGSRTSRNVNIYCVAGQTSTIKLTRFNNGNCIESCETFTCIPDDTECQASIQDIWCNRTVGPFANNYPLIIDSRVRLTNPFPNTASGVVKWNPEFLSGIQSAGGVFGNLAGNAENVVFPSQFYVNISTTTGDNPNGFYVPMIVTYEDNVTGATCTVELNPLIIGPCDGGNGIGIGIARNSVSKENVKLYPNPSGSNSEVKFDGIDTDELESIELIDFNGNTLQSVKQKGNAFNTTHLKTGVYFVRFKTKYGIIQKRLMIK